MIRRTSWICSCVVGHLLVASLAAQRAGGVPVSVSVYGPLYEPIPNATIAVRHADWSVAQEGKTDGSGQFFFTGEEGSWMYCCATAADLHFGCEFTRPLTRASSAHLDIRLFAAAAIRGVVRDGTGKTVPGAQVIAAFDSAPLILFMGGEPEVAVTDANGAYTLPRVPCGDIIVRASADGFELGETPIYLREDASVDVVMKRGKGRELTIAVEGVPPERLSDIEWRLLASPEWPQQGMELPPRLVHGVLDEKGNVVVRGLPRAPRLAAIRLEAQGMRFLPDSQDVAPKVDGKVTFKLEAITGPRPRPRNRAPVQAPAKDPSPTPLVPTKVANPTLQGVLHDDAGKALGLTLVQIYAERTGWHEAVTDADGTFAVDAKYEKGDRVAFSLKHPNWVLVAERSEAGLSTPGTVWREHARSTVQNLVATKAATVEGKVSVPPGESPSGFLVLVEEKGAEGDLPRTMAGMGTTDASGAFVIEGLLASDRPVWVVVRSIRGTAEAGPLVFDERRKLEGLDLKVKAALQVTGTVLDKSGKPLPGARVTLVAPLTRPQSIPIGENVTLTDKKGRFAFRGMNEGDYTIEIQVRGMKVVATTKSFDVSERKRVPEQRIKVTSN